MDKKQKLELGQRFVSKFKEANGAILAEFRGMSVAELSELRSVLRKSQSEFKVIKNRVAKKAAEEGGLGLIKEDFKGPSGLVLLKGDAVETAKSVVEFQKTHPNFVVKCGLIDNQRLSLDQIEDISKLPSKDVLLARIVGTLVAPHRGILGVLSGVPRQLVQVINAIKDTKVG